MNPYTQLSTDDAEIIQIALTAVGNVFREQGHEDKYHKAMELLQRVQQYARAGEGIPQDLMAKYAERFGRAMMEKNRKVIITTLRDWISTMMRLSPDPAKEIAGFLTQMTLAQAGFAQISQGGALVLSRVEQKVQALKDNYEWPSADAALEFLCTWLGAGGLNLQNGSEPWPGDDEVEPLQ